MQDDPDAMCYISREGILPELGDVGTTPASPKPCTRVKDFPSGRTGSLIIIIYAAAAAVWAVDHC